MTTFDAKAPNPADLLADTVARVASIMDKFGSVGHSADREALSREIINTLAYDLPLMGFTPDHVVDPVSGLRFYPSTVSKTWQEHTQTFDKFNRKQHQSYGPIEFLCEQFAPYLEVGLLYTGHIKAAHPRFYETLYTHVSRLPDYASPHDFFRKQGILTSEDLADPALEVKSRAEVIMAVNIALRKQKSIRANVISGSKRHRTAPAKKLP